jgi:hypothetical protein
VKKISNCTLVFHLSYPDGAATGGNGFDSGFFPRASTMLITQLHIGLSEALRHTVYLHIPVCLGTGLSYMQEISHSIGVVFNYTIPKMQF